MSSMPAPKHKHRVPPPVEAFPQMPAKEGRLWADRLQVDAVDT